MIERHYWLIFGLGLALADYSRRAPEREREEILATGGSLSQGQRSAVQAISHILQHADREQAYVE